MKSLNNLKIEGVLLDSFESYLLDTWILGRLVLFSEAKDSQFVLEGCHCGCRDDIFLELVPGINYSDPYKNECAPMNALM